MSFLGIDLGTSGLRAILVDEDSQVLGSATREYATRHPQDGWSEQDPAQWIAALEDAVSELGTQVPAFADLRGIGVAGHMHGATLLDKNGAVIRPCILWNDTRSGKEAAELDSLPGVRQLSGNIVFPGFTAPKLAWLRQHEPESFAKTAKVLLPAAYVNFYLTNDYVGDVSDGSGTAWLDVAQRTWSGDLLDAGNMQAAQMPRVIEGTERAGSLRADLAKRWGVPTDVTVAGGAGDNAAAACGIGALPQGQGFVSLGTSGVVLAARDGYCPAPETAVHTFCHAVPQRWYQMGVMLAATDALNWLSRLTDQSPADLTRALGPTLDLSNDVRFLPYLSGERTPHNDADIRGAFTGLATSTTREDVTRAVLEGVCFGLRDSAEALIASGATLEQPFVVGGGAASDHWVKLLASILKRPLALPAGQECGAALGAARLGICAATGRSPDDVMLPPKTLEVIDPDDRLSDVIEDRYEGFKAAYPLVKQAQ